MSAEDFTPRIGRRIELASHPKFSVFADEVDVPGEPETRRYRVVAPRGGGPDLITGTCVLPVRDGRYALLCIYRHAIRAESWEIPRGFVDGETAVVAARRELEEKTGLTCAPSSLKPLGLVTPDAGVFAARIQLFAALDCRDT